MFRVLVAEDEPPIMRAIVGAIEQGNPNFHIVATAINGKKAIEELEKNHIDVVFTDIRMPVMDGLSLAKHIRENYPYVLTVIISGYQDFEYARQAIEFKAYDYLLKPISKDKLSVVLAHIEEELSRKKHEMKRNMLSNAIIDKKEVFADSECIVILICAGAMLMYGNDTLVPALAFWDKVSIDDILSSIVEGEEGYIVFHGNFVSERIVVIEPASRQRMNEIAQSIFEKISKIGITVTIACRGGIKLSEAGENFAKLRECALRNVILTKSQILYYDDIKEKDTVCDYSIEQLEAAAKAISTGNMKKVKDFLISVFCSMEKNNATQEDVMNFLDMLVNQYYLQNPSADKKIGIIKREIRGAVANFLDYESLAEDISSIISAIKTENKNGKQPKLIEEIEVYLIKNYNKSITNTVLSKEFGFVPSYISRLFRQYKGVSPSEYLIRYRIEKAKQLMKENPDLLVKEIADMVGFKEAYYFSKTFKKETGVWPSDYHG
ncbi:MAG: response regulator [Clostridia bacterium]|nr:response regulator [Clostridia bacterium]